MGSAYCNLLHYIMGIISDTSTEYFLTELNLEIVTLVLHCVVPENIHAHPMEG